MKIIYLLPLALLISCGGESVESSESSEQTEEIVDEWIPPIDTIEVIEENYWEVKTDDYEFPHYIYPYWSGMIVFGREYDRVYLKGDTLRFEFCNKGKEYDFGAQILVATEDSLTLKFYEDSKHLPEAGTVWEMTNDRRFWHEDFDLELVSFATADPMRERMAYNVEFDSSKYVFKDRFLNGGNDIRGCFRCEMKTNFFNDAEELLSKMDLDRMQNPVKDAEFISPYKLMVKYNGKTKTIEGVEWGRHPRMKGFMNFLRSRSPRRDHEPDGQGVGWEDVQRFIRHGVRRGEMDEIDDYDFAVGEYDLRNIYEEMIMEDVMEEMEEEQ